MTGGGEVSPHVQAGHTLTGEEPVAPQVVGPGPGVQQGVDVADGGDLPGRQVSLRHHPELLPLEDDRAVGRAGVVELAGQQVEADTEWLTGDSPEVDIIIFSLNSHVGRDSRPSKVFS